MYALIDRTNMRFHALHQDHTALSKLAWIELPHVAVIVLPCDHISDLRTFTDVELSLLYTHTTGERHPSTSRVSLLTSTIALCMQLPKRPLNGFELDVQYRNIPEGDDAVYLYVEGGQRAQRKGDLFETAYLKGAQRYNNEQLMELARALGPESPATPAVVHPTPEKRPSAPRTPSAAAPSLPKGGNKQIIWDTMDKVWGEAGKPTDVKVILALRKAVMDQLEAQGLKRTSASSELGNWQKVRAPQ